MMDEFFFLLIYWMFVFLLVHCQYFFLVTALQYHGNHFIAHYFHMRRDLLRFFVY